MAACFADRAETDAGPSIAAMLPESHVSSVNHPLGDNIVPDDLCQTNRMVEERTKPCARLAKIRCGACFRIIPIQSNQERPRRHVQD